MIVYVHKVRSSIEDGWGVNLGMQIETLGMFQNREDALKHKEKRDLNRDARHHDIGPSWIEEVEVK